MQKGSEKVHILFRELTSKLLIAYYNVIMQLVVIYILCMVYYVKVM